MIELDARLRDALRRYRATRSERSPLETSLDAVVLYSDLGGDALLTLDGRLLQDSPFDGLGEIASVILQRAALFLGSRRVPELSRVFPQRPVDASECEPCSGTGWIQLKVDFKIACGHCGGMGWQDDEVRRELANPTGRGPAG